MAAHTEIRITVPDVKHGRVAVRSPYHPDFPKRAREIGGTWERGNRVWTFPRAMHEQARDLCVLCFGTESGVPTKPIPKRERKASKAKASGLSAYSTDDLLAELRRRGVVPAASPVDEPLLAPPEPAFPAPEPERADAFTL
jgi:hypothetical protein